ncbi:uncharacterized protein LOC124640922 [Helicoverpa zea]|uniref:uncharacterized protein LOC124640922 n=1 Tax=Helicoverpa zea TaxID=7113 RepID=UPI001F55F080|nr:uncharacterized protein LOC124640922 [Helicoverpa zea]
MNILRLSVESNSVSVNITAHNEIAKSIRAVRKSLSYYDKLLDSFENLAKILQYELTIYWVTEFLRASIITYNALQGLISSKGEHLVLQHSNSVMTLNLMEVIISVALISCPAIIVEATVYEVNRIKKTLTAQILKCSDEYLRFELQTALQYVRLRPFRYTLCRAVPLDINLLFTTAALCITYVIVALQLTHFAA